MKNTIIVKVGFCKTFGIYVMLNTIMTSFKSNEVVGWQRQWVITLKASVQILVNFFMWSIVFVNCIVNIIC